MGLADDLKAGPPQRAYRLRVDELLDELEPADRTELARVLADLAWNARRVSEVLGRNGHRVSPTAVSRWREVNGVG